MTDSTSRPLGHPRGILFGIVLFIVTFSLYGYYWTYKTHEEIKQYTGEGVGGVVGVIILFFVGFLTPFVVPSEVGKMYRRDGQEPPVSGWTGLWILLPLAGIFIWFVKTQGGLNRYWESKGALPA
jgi:Domain of unknown function (DUF4234)